jgi:hypothetical protein
LRELVGLVVKNQEIHRYRPLSKTVSWIIAISYTVWNIIFKTASSVIAC